MMVADVEVVMITKTKQSRVMLARTMLRNSIKMVIKWDEQLT